MCIYIRYILYKNKNINNITYNTNTHRSQTASNSN